MTRTTRAWTLAVVAQLLSATAMAAAKPALVSVLHTPASESERGSEVLIKCVISAKNGVYLPTVYYRRQGQTQYYPVPLIPIEGNLYATAVPGIFFMENLEYYIEARDLKDFVNAALVGSPEKPFLVKAVEKAPKQAQLAITSDPPGGALAIDGVAVGKTPYLGSVEPGEHSVVISKAGFKTVQTTLNVAAGRELELRYPLAPNAQPAQLAVLTDPAGARLILAGKLLGESPFMGPAPEGDYELVIEKDGYHRTARSIRFRNDRNVELTITLLKLPPEPALAVTTEPPGAILSVDGTDLGRTPFLGVIAPGEHEIALRKEGLRGLGAQIVMPKDRDLDLRFTIEPAPLEPLPPQVAIASEPAGADVFIDDEKAGQTPLARALPPGEHKVRLVMAGFVSYERTFSMPKDRDMEITLALTPVPPPPGPSAVSIATQPPEAEIYVDGQLAGKGSWQGKKNPGDYQVTAKLAGYRTLNEKYSVVAGQGVSLKLSLTPLPKEAAAPLLTIQSEPAGATILVDGKELGKTPYQGEVPPGEHSVALNLSGFKARQESFKVPSDREFELRVNWALEPIRRSVTVPSAAKRQTQALAPLDAQEARDAELAKATGTQTADPAQAKAELTRCPEALCAPAEPVEKVQRVWYRANAIPWIATAVGVVAVGTGVALAAHASGIAKEISSGQLESTQATYLEGFKSRVADFNRYNRASQYLIAGGGGLAAGVDLYWLISSALADDPPPEEVKTRRSEPEKATPAAPAAPEGPAPAPGKDAEASAASQEE